MIATRETTVREIVVEDFRAAAVFHQFGIDFCCGGRRTLGEACRAHNVSTDDVISELERASAQPDVAAPRFAGWEPETLIGYIVGNHHAYVRKALPSITAHTQKVAHSHGAKHPEFYEIAQIFESVAAEMAAHMAKEEEVLFPYIAAAANAVRSHRPAPHAPFGAIDNPIRMMEAEHESAGAAMARIRELTTGYEVPPDVCTTYRICLQELEAFERDLHTHVHLENNILFPKARTLVARAFA